MVKFFINRPIFATVLALIIVVAGLVTLNILPIAQYPEITPPTVQVSAVYPGADAQTVAQTVGLPIEQQVNGVDGMLYMSSNSSSSGGLLPNDHLRRGNGYRHGDRHGAKPGEYRPEQLAGTRDRTRYHHPQAILQYCDDAYPKFQGFHLRRVVFK